jgi:hypothetical protein
VAAARATHHKSLKSFSQLMAQGSPWCPAHADGTRDRWIQPARPWACRWSTRASAAWLPFELRRAAAFRADVATALGRIFIEAVACEQKRTAGVAQSQPAAMNHLQRFGGAMNLNLPFHAVVVDGVFALDDAGRVRFHETGAPSREALERIVHRVRDRTMQGHVRGYIILPAREITALFAKSVDENPSDFAIV